jgi:hypothetical protein
MSAIIDAIFKVDAYLTEYRQLQYFTALQKILFIYLILRSLHRRVIRSATRGYSHHLQQQEFL